MTTKTYTPEQLAAINSVRVAMGQAPLSPAPEKKVRSPRLTTKLPKEWTTYDQLTRIAYIMSKARIWKPIGVVCNVTTQHCDCCKSSVQFVNNLFIRFKHVGTESIWDYPMPMSPDFAALPRIYAQSDQSVPECASCFTSNLLQADPTDQFVDCHTNLSRTALFREAARLRAQGELFLENANGITEQPLTEQPSLHPLEGQTTQSRPLAQDPYPITEGGFSAHKYAIPRSVNPAVDVWDEELNNRSSAGGISPEALSH